MRVEIGNAALVDELAQALRRCEFRVMRVGSHELEVKLGPAQHGAAEIEGAAELELDLYLKAWEAEHPGRPRHPDKPRLSPADPAPDAGEPGRQRQPFGSPPLTRRERGGAAAG